MQAQTSQQCVVVRFDTYCMNARGKINIYDIPILSFNISLDNPNLANLVSRQVLAATLHYFYVRNSYFNSKYTPKLEYLVPFFKIFQRKYIYAP